jgi:hypothetical protein
MVTAKKSVIVFLLFSTLLYAGEPAAEAEFRELYLRHYPMHTDRIDGFIATMNELQVLVADTQSSSRYSANKIKTVLRDEIAKYPITTRSIAEIILLYYLVRLDATIDYYWLNDKRSGANKNYVMSYVLGRYDAGRAKDVVSEETFFLGGGGTFVSRESIIETEYALLYYSYKEIREQLIDDYIRSFRMVYDLLDKEQGRYTGKEYEEVACSYYYNNSGTWSLGEQADTKQQVYDRLIPDLFVMSDYREDIRLHATQELVDVCKDAAAFLAADIPVVEFRSSESEYEYLFRYNETVMVAVTYRREKADYFFNLYYGQNVRDNDYGN